MGYTRPAIFLHWGMALLLVAGFGLGLTMVEMAFSPQKLKFYSWHKWIGVTVFTLAAIRLGWRLAHPPPPLPPDLAAWQASVAHATHVLLYVLFFLIPITGWLFSSAKGIPTVYLGLVPLPDLLTKDAGEWVLWATDPEQPFTLAELLRQTHHWLNYLLAALVAAHIAAALKHYWIDRDEVLARMLPALAPKPIPASPAPKESA